MKANSGRGGWLEMLTNDLSFEGMIDNIGEYYW